MNELPKSPQLYPHAVAIKNRFNRMQETNAFKRIRFPTNETLSKLITEISDGLLADGYPKRTAEAELFVYTDRSVLVLYDIPGYEIRAGHLVDVLMSFCMADVLNDTERQDTDWQVVCDTINYLYSDTITGNVPRKILQYFGQQGIAPVYLFNPNLSSLFHPDWIIAGFQVLGKENPRMLTMLHGAVFDERYLLLPHTELVSTLLATMESGTC